MPGITYFVALPFDVADGTVGRGRLLHDRQKIHAKGP
jgi:hypothetical protein